MLNGDVVTFDVDLPESCAGKCADAYAWALSAFASGPWERGEVRQWGTSASVAVAAGSLINGDRAPMLTDPGQHNRSG